MSGTPQQSLAEFFRTAPFAEIREFSPTPAEAAGFDSVAQRLLERLLFITQPFSLREQRILGAHVRQVAGPGLLKTIDDWRKVGKSPVASIAPAHSAPTNDMTLVCHGLGLALGHYQLDYPKTGGLVQNFRASEVLTAYSPFAVSSRAYLCARKHTLVIVARMTDRLLQAALDREDSPEVALESLEAMYASGRLALLKRDTINLVRPGWFVLTTCTAAGPNPGLIRIPVNEPIPVPMRKTG